MKKIVLWFGIISMLLIISFSSCATPKAGIARPNIPMKEQCIITWIEGAEGSTETFQYGDINILEDDWAGAEYKILPAGKNMVWITQKYSWKSTIGNTETYTYNWYYESWEGVFDFKPGKYYSIKLTALGGREKESIDLNDSGASFNRSSSTIKHQTNSNIEIVEDPKKNMGSIYIKPYAGTTVGTRFYDYIPSLGILNIGPTFGIQIIKGYLNMDLGVEGLVGGGMSYQGETEHGDLKEGERGMGISVTYDYGAYINFSLWRFVLGGGVGMANGTVWCPIGKVDYDYGYAHYTKENSKISYDSIPYVEFVLGFTGPVFRRSTPSLNIYGRYYLLEDGDNNSKIAVGFKGRF